MNKVITIIIIIWAIFSIFLVSQIIKECNGQKPRIEKLESPSSINNPFQKDCITSIDISMDKSLFDSKDYHFSGYVKFKNGNTSGKQEFEGESLEDIYNQIYKFCEDL